MWNNEAEGVGNKALAMRTKYSWMTAAEFKNLIERLTTKDMDEELLREIVSRLA